MWCAPAIPQGPGIQERGKELFAHRCGGCHALDRNQEGPRLRGAFGRKAASLADFEYSDALRKSGIAWNAENLERWLRDPDAVAPGTDMAFRVPNGEERQALIAYLKSLSAMR